jgi:integrase
MAKPFQEGTGWAFRLRVDGQDIYRSGYQTEPAARKAQNALLAEINNKDASVGRGPFRTSLAAAFSDYACACPPYLKGAPADAGRINRYLRAMNMPVIHLHRVDDPSGTAKVYWAVKLVREATQTIPGSLRVHRSNQATNASQCDAVRRRLASMMMADVTTNEVQSLVNALRSAGYKSATIALERAELRRVFNLARTRWKWTRPVDDPACNLDMPPADIPRETILTNEQWQGMSKALCEAGNQYAPALFCLMLETAMRSCEPLTYARWKHVNFSRMVLELPDAKAGRRDVPLGPGAIAILRILETRVKEKKKSKRSEQWSPEDKIFPTTYEAVKKAWSVARKTCALGDVRMHDLRHTAATRYALQFKGDLPVIMKITGHETVEMVMRYINIKTDAVVSMMHGKEPDIAKQAAGYKVSNVDVLLRAQAEIDKKPDEEHASDTTTVTIAPSNIVRIDFGRRAA